MSKDNTQDELRERIGNLKPHTETQLPLKDILSYLEMNALIEVVNSEVRQVLDRLEQQALEAQYYIPNSPDDTYTSGEVVRLSAIEAERKRYDV